MRRKLILFIILLSQITGNLALASSEFFSFNATKNTGRGEISVTTDKDVYVYGEMVNITVKNIGKVNIVGVSKLRIYYISENCSYLVHEPSATELIKNLLVNQSWNYSWDQKDFNGSQVEKGRYLIHFFIGDCRGTQASNSTIIFIQGPIYIESIDGGFGVFITIANIGKEDIYDVNFLTEISGLVISGASMEESIDIFHAGERLIMHLTPFGIGPASIKVTAGGEEKTAKCLIFGPFVIKVGNGCHISSNASIPNRFKAFLITHFVA